MAPSANSPTSVDPPTKTPPAKTPPTETPPAEGSIAEAHTERADGGIWEHPAFWAGIILFGSLVFAAFFIARIFGYGG